MKSTDWFENAKGWKSTQGGFSAIQPVSTDQNNMGGFFIRKIMGGAGCAVHLHKLLPLLFYQESYAQWSMGHYQPLLITALMGNIAIVAFYATYLEDLAASQAQLIPYVMITVLLMEALVILFYLLQNKRSGKSTTSRLPAIAMPAGKTPTSPVSNIVARTTCIVTTLIAIVAVRDLCFPGTIIGILPGDDLYLEWTNAFLHSPPANSPEAIDQGMEAPLYIGDKFVSQLAALYVLILCAYKYASAILVRFGADGSGTMKARMIWKTSFVGDALLLFCFRLFTHAARTASVDTRFHLVLLAYEAFIFGLYGFF
jgi:hypothetical protein